MSHPVDPTQSRSGGYDSGSAGGSSPAGYSGEYSTDPPDYPGHPDHDVTSISVGDIMSSISEDLSTLMRQEIQLAKVEMTTEAKKAGMAAGMLGGAGFAAYFLVLFASITLWQALANWFDDSAWAALVVTVLWGIAAAVLAMIGRKKLQEVNPKPERTVETLQETPSALKPTNP